MSDNQTLNVIFSRSSYRGSFKNEPVPREDLVAILKAGSGSVRLQPADHIFCCSGRRGTGE